MRCPECKSEILRCPKCGGVLEPEHSRKLERGYAEYFTCPDCQRHVRILNPS